MWAPVTDGPSRVEQILTVLGLTTEGDDNDGDGDADVIVLAEYTPRELALELGLQ